MSPVVEHRRGTAAALHEDDWPSAVAVHLRHLEVTGPALVLGSTQPRGDVDHHAAAAAGVEVVRRRSGGGAVLLVPGDSIWIDLFLPRSDPRWDERLEQAFLWAGRAWQEALRSLAAEPTDLHRGGLVVDDAGRSLCFAGRGPGEVLVGVAGEQRKLVGLSQRRARWGARVQCLVHRRIDLDLHRALLGDGAQVLDERVAVLDAAPGAVVSALAAALDRGD